LKRKSDCLQPYYQFWFNILPHLLSQCPVRIQLKIFHTIIKLEKKRVRIFATLKQKISNGQRLEGYWKNIGDDYEEKQNDLSTAEKGTIRKRPKMIKGRETNAKAP
jgi:hypothetical protein